jgi:hypothetical protein
VSPTFELDHLVVAAASLDDGIRWCEKTLGVTPGAGGRHALMGTHNRLLATASPRFARAYLEIIAIDPAATAPKRDRWFGLDDPALQARLASDGPQLVHWVARTPDIDTVRAAMAAAGADPGDPTAATRGDFRWRITLRDDGIPQRGGAVPALIQWDGDAHPTDTMVACGVMLQALKVAGVDCNDLDPRAVATGVVYRAALSATLTTPRGVVTLATRGWLPR